MSWFDVAVRRRAVIASVVWAMAVLPVPAEEEKTPDLDVPYVPTHQAAVEAMLKLAKVTAKDYVIDLGCGDGRIVITAAKDFQARGLGVDLDPVRIRESKENASKAEVTSLVEFRKGDVMDVDVRQASVVTLFLLEEVNLRLRPKLFAELKPGTRVVSNSFSMSEWKADKKIRHKKAYNEVIYLWIMPAPVAGTWTWQTKLPDKELPGSLKLEQEFQVVQGVVSMPGAPDVAIVEPKLTGKELRFTAPLRTEKEQVMVAYRGTADGDTIRGTQTWRGGDHAGKYPWVATRKPVDLTGRWQIRAPSLSQINGTLCIRRESAGLKAAYVHDAEPTKEVPLPAFYVWGSGVRFEISQDDSQVVLTGSLGADAGGGSVSREKSKKREPWSAKRLAGK